MNYLILGVNGAIGKSIFNELYNSDDNFILTYNSNKPNLSQKNTFLFQLNFNNFDKSIENIKKIIKKFKQIDVVINNVGNANPFKDVINLKKSDLDNSMNINFYSPYFIILEVLKKNLKSKSSLNVINISSNTIKFYGSQNNTSYLISKNALEIGLLNLSKIFIKNKIKINIIRPGLLKTNMKKNLKNYSHKNFVDRKKLIPIGKLGEPSDISNLVSFLTSKKNKFIFGQILTVSGGE
jgi:NAD(P)-dependent dehydrogenase (short-subunit alcohol dehydrogenase family)